MRAISITLALRHGCPILAGVTYRGILLDFYGTVVEEDDLVVRAIVDKLADEYPGVSGRDLGHLWWDGFSSTLTAAHGRTFRTQRDLTIQALGAVLDQLGSDLDPVELTQELFDFWRRPALLPGAAEFLASCPVPICVVSNIDSADIRATITHHGLSLPLVVTSEDVRSYKPRPELFERGLELLQLEPGEVLHIGDSLTSDIAGANALGIDVAWVNTKAREAPASARIRQHITDLREVLLDVGVEASASAVR